jgi:hypothetical protein
MSWFASANVGLQPNEGVAISNIWFGFRNIPSLSEMSEEVWVFDSLMMAALCSVVPCSPVDKTDTVCYLYGITSHKTTGILFYMTTHIAKLLEEYFVESQLVYGFIACWTFVC